MCIPDDTMYTMGEDGEVTETVSISDEGKITKRKGGTLGIPANAPEGTGKTGKDDK
jgi:hypothetical protein